LLLCCNRDAGCHGSEFRDACYIWHVAVPARLWLHLSSHKIEISQKTGVGRVALFGRLFPEFDAQRHHRVRALRTSPKLWHGTPPPVLAHHCGLRVHQEPPGRSTNMIGKKKERKRNTTGRAGSGGRRGRLKFLCCNFLISYS